MDGCTWAPSSGSGQPVGLVPCFGRALHLRAQGAEEGFQVLPALGWWLQAQLGPCVAARAQRWQERRRKRWWLAQSIGRVIHSAGESCSLLQRLSGKGASWAGVHQNRSVSDLDEVTGTVTSILPVAVRFYALPNFWPPVLSGRNNQRSGRTESPVAPVPQVGTAVEGPQQGFCRTAGAAQPQGLLWWAGKCSFSRPAGHWNACKEQKAPKFVRDRIFCPYK